MSEDKVRENRARRVAQRQGLKLIKSRSRNPLVQDYGMWWIVKPENDSGHWRSLPLVSPEQGFCLEEVEEYLASA